MATDKEMVTAPKFNESVKNALRDYYVYGFKKWPKKSKASQTQRADWQRLQAVLPDYLTWSDLLKRMLLIITRFAMLLLIARQWMKIHF